jgi:nucleotide-binding universal stress UspA family protein
MVIISFSLKPLSGSERTFEDAILPVIEDIAATHGGEVLHHGFMPKAYLEEKGIPTTIPDSFQRLFGEFGSVVSHFDVEAGKPNREALVEIAKDNDTSVYVIGPIVEGVLEEIVAYSTAGSQIICYPWAALS